tara:strand:- start:224 stop:703 length:480 start_codon:yes stop_codon:yes gene_type:complete
MNEEIEELIDGAPDYLQDVLRALSTERGNPIQPVRPPLMGEIRTLNYEPKNGYVYTAVASPIPYRGFEGGGNVDEYILLTIWSPSYGRTGLTNVIQKNSYLAEHYVKEKFDPEKKLGEHLEHVTALARLILVNCQEPSLGAEGKPLIDLDWDSIIEEDQ